MKIVFTGGVTGGHFYPIIAVAEGIKDVCKKKKIIEPNLYFFSPDPYNKKLLFDNKISYVKIPAGKLRIYSSKKNISDLFITFWGVIKSLWELFWLYPDVVFSKGGSGSFPVTFAARILGIPVIIHESDCAPGRANIYASKFAKKIAVSYPEAANFFPQEKVAHTGNPIRKALKISLTDGAAEYLDLSPNIPIILILGGSQGAQIINEMILNGLPELIKKYQIIHQVGKNNFDEYEKVVKVLIKNPEHLKRYRIYPYLDDLAMKMSAGAANLIISRAGSTIFEISNWQKPSILIPITESQGNHQRKNAYIYARTGAATVIEEANLSDKILISEIDRILNNSEIQQSMIRGAKEFSKINAAETIAQEIILLAIKHK
ncbi:MAG TPA: UDP-N-acetylglucosamine--N-acetylmuramyl-(pentapeptide) pyrophosphoryl-undecaprenol N-acetylglucosamine transferase [Candidatus Paceibacterota bacterium]|nr:UDP-N-acetylglucosamine--N-acetylmuramyl-(pentapeptide) pyrophosphoryl-undecaprenol N-acetylglucosamine transferase [Candidatus Paceibacterota bacterium]HMP18736.1 UDP-N-acetylglucosamine--N-acetylmuramyl-(pentapeptide) pyrophosphoryl-undecaprenol N-acetylglucosamine transferase [Candidatus Paceibacterota bacterium]HMP85257.1 UDP-N-acetylglucosamine--N-acetylmuramyl-(pentapeptide) pyrophosphoryl-undecaprenol N-acetylglucosamine transferase [Candidatus Paceibacterota bacterium]